MISGDLNNVDLPEICRKYHGIRLGITSCNKYFLFYVNGKCRAQVVGINMLGRFLLRFAEYLKLENAKDYTSHCMRRSSATFLADSVADQTDYGSFRDSLSHQGKCCIGFTLPRSI